ncbi:MAG TPA: sigma 54-interacting transcriptional regulator [Myxococcota bacterium]|nr:sigma 54-interacting transcriptional regulator [Myxococcota bacterium]
MSGPERGTEMALGDGGVVGSGSDADFMLNDRTVSAKHARIDVRDDGLHVTDLSSTNGTFYLDTRIREVTVQPGAVLALGTCRIALVLPEPLAAPDHRDGYGAIIGSAPSMQRMYAMLDRLTRTAGQAEPTVLITGETGVGKELVAREIHASSARRAGPFEVFDASAVAANLIESELFGHVRGAFTGADRDRVGVFARARGGTVFIDEVGELPLDLQPKLLRVLENREARPVGSNVTSPVDVRIVAATNRNLEEEVERGGFRRDLYFRLNVVTIDVPPLRERISDIPLLVEHFTRSIAHESSPLSPDTLELLISGYSWPGNVRELRNALASVLIVGTLPSNLSGPSQRESITNLSEPLLKARKRVLEAFEHDYLVHQMQRAQGNVTEAARLSSMDRSYFKRLLTKHRLDDDDA